MAQQKLIEAYTPSKDRLDRVVESSNFDIFHIEISKIETLLLLLQSTEEEILVQVLHHLNNFGVKGTENFIELFNMRLFDVIMDNELYNSEFLFVHRFAFKIMAHLINITEDGMSIKHKLMKNEKLFDLVKEQFLICNDHFLVEYFSKLMDKFCEEPRYCDQMIQNDQILLKLHEWLAKTRDSDIFTNLTNILYQLTTNPYGLVKISTPAYIPFEVVMGSLKSKFTAIQISSLRLLSNLVLSNGFNDYLKNQFLNEIFNILDNLLWNDLHLDAILVIRNAMVHEDVTQNVYQSLYLNRLFMYFNKIKENQSEVIGIFSRLAQFGDAREIMFRQGLIPQLLEFVRERPSVNVILCLGLMVEHYDSLVEVLKSTVILDLLNVLNDPRKDFDTRTSAANTLVVLTRLDKKMGSDLVENDGSACIAQFFDPSILTRQSKIHLDLIALINIMSKFEDLRPKLMNENLASNIERAIEKLTGTAGVTLLCELINCISLYVTEPIVQEVLIRQNLSKWIISGLKHSQIKVQSTINDFIILTTKYFPFCNEYVYGGVLRILLAGKEAICDCPNWSAAIDAILANNIIVKFAIKRCLDFNDLTSDGFYCSKKHFDNFQTLIEIMDSEVSPLAPIYLVNFHHDQVDSDKCIQLLEGTLDEEIQYDRCPIDVFLPRYVEKIREEFNFYGLAQLKKMSYYSDMADIKKRIEVIAKLVVTKLTPPITSVDECFDHVFDLHLRDLKMALHCNIIPLGKLNAGELFEKALLFKVLADHVGVPCTLRLGIDNITAWNEISLYAPRKYIGISLLPRAYLESTHLVDLQKFPGSLYPMNSVESWEYRKLNCGRIK